MNKTIFINNKQFLSTKDIYFSSILMGEEWISLRVESRVPLGRRRGGIELASREKLSISWQGREGGWNSLCAHRDLSHIEIYLIPLSKNYVLFINQVLLCNNFF